MDKMKKQEKYTIIFTRLFSTYASDEIGEEIMEHQFDHWHLESECGAMFELDGVTLLEIFNKHKETCKEVVEVAKEVDENEYYRVEVSY